MGHRLTKVLSLCPDDSLVEANGHPVVDHPCNIEPGEVGGLAFCTSALHGCKTYASIIICKRVAFEVSAAGRDKARIYVDNPKLVFAKVCTELWPPKKIYKSGFGFVRQEDGSLFRFPHYGKTIMGKDVEIGEHVCIDRGALGNTIIGNGVKIDNLVHIAHNVEIGEHSLIVAGTVLGGSCKIGKRCFIGMSASIKNGVVIGDDVTIGMGAVVLRDIPDGETWVGNPARKL